MSVSLTYELSVLIRYSTALFVLYCYCMYTEPDMIASKILYATSWICRFKWLQWHNWL